LPPPQAFQTPLSPNPNNPSNQPLKPQTPQTQTPKPKPQSRTLPPTPPTNPKPQPQPQEDCDLAYFDIDIKGIQRRCAKRGDIKHVRFPVRDFDPFDLRRKLPKAVARLASAHQPKFGTAYIHCTAGASCSGAAGLLGCLVAWLSPSSLSPHPTPLLSTL